MLEEHTERELADRLFDLVWDLLEQPSRTAEPALHHARRSLAIFLGDLADLPF